MAQINQIKAKTSSSSAVDFNSSSGLQAPTDHHPHQIRFSAELQQAYRNQPETLNELRHSVLGKLRQLGENKVSMQENQSRLTLKLKQLRAYHVAAKEQ